jgi:hypothetical protein
MPLTMSGSNVSCLNPARSFRTCHYLHVLGRSTLSGPSQAMAFKAHCPNNCCSTNTRSSLSLLALGTSMRLGTLRRRRHGDRGETRFRWKQVQARKTRVCSTTNVTAPRSFIHVFIRHHRTNKNPSHAMPQRVRRTVSLRCTPRAPGTPWHGHDRLFQAMS